MPEIIQDGLSQIAIDRIKQLDELKFRKKLRAKFLFVHSIYANNSVIIIRLKLICILISFFQGFKYFKSPIFV